MILENSLLIVGAGASVDLEFPTGSELVNHISQKLQFTLDAFQKVEGDQRLWLAISDECATLGGSQYECFLESIEISQGLWNAESIDNYVHTHRNRKFVPTIAKLAIALFILGAEKQTKLAVNTDFKAHRVPKDYWVSNFCRKHFVGYDTGNLDSIFDRVSVVCFNYDRNIQQAFRIAIANHFRLTDNEATALVSKLRVIHPYGSLGDASRHAGCCAPVTRAN